MKLSSTQLVLGVSVCVALLGTSGLAAFYSQRAASARAQVAQARSEVEVLRHKLLLQQPNSPDIVLKYTSADSKPVPTLIVQTNIVASQEQEERIRQLEATLQSKERQIAAFQDRATNRMAAAFQPGRGQSWLDDLKRTDPERYQEFVKRREEQHKEVSNAFAEKAAKLLENEPPNTSEEQQAERTMMLQLVSETWKMAEQLYANPPPENRGEVVHNMRENLDTLRPMLDNERNRMFQQLAVESGYTDQDSQLFVDYLNDVIETTSIQPLSRAMRRGRGDWRGGGGSWGAPPTGTPPATTPQK